MTHYRLPGMSKRDSHLMYYGSSHLSGYCLFLSTHCVPVVNHLHQTHRWNDTKVNRRFPGNTCGLPNNHGSNILTLTLTFSWQDLMRLPPRAERFTARSLEPCNMARVLISYNNLNQSILFTNLTAAASCEMCNL